MDTGWVNQLVAAGAIDVTFWLLLAVVGLVGEYVRGRMWAELVRAAGAGSTLVEDSGDGRVMIVRTASRPCACGEADGRGDDEPSGRLR